MPNNPYQNQDDQRRAQALRLFQGQPQQGQQVRFKFGAMTPTNPEWIKRHGQRLVSPNTKVFGRV